MTDATTTITLAGAHGTALATGLMSVMQELVVLLVFFATWSLTRQYRQSGSELGDEEKLVAQKQHKAGKSPEQLAKVITSLCADQFTRALRLYRDMVKHDLDRQIVDEDFYTAMVEAAVRVGKTDVAEQILQRMHGNGVQPSAAFIQSLLKMLAARKLFRNCIDVHARFGVGHGAEPVVFSCLILAGSEVGETALARDLAIEQQLPSRESIPLMRAYVRLRDWEGAVAHVRHFMARGAELDNIVVNTALAACLTTVGAVGTMAALVDDVAEYDKRFAAEGRAPSCDIVSYNTLMKAHARAHDLSACFELLDTILAREVQPDGVTFSTLLDVCIQENEHDLASVALDRMLSSGVKMTCVLMTTLMKGFIRSKRLDKATSLYETMRTDAAPVKPDMITYSLLIKAYCDAGQMDHALNVLEDMLRSGCAVDDIVFTHLIDGCCQVSNVTLAEKLFRDMVQAKIQPSIYAITGLVKVYGKCGQSEKAMDLVRTMEQTYNVKPTVVVFTCVVSGLLRQKKHAEAWVAFQCMRAHCELDSHCVQTLVSGLSDGGMWPEINGLVRECLSRGEPAISTECLNHALTAMVNRGSLEAAQDLHQLMTTHAIEVPATTTKRLGL